MIDILHLNKVYKIIYKKLKNLKTKLIKYMQINKINLKKLNQSKKLCTN